jgi:TIGR03009 family protein
MRAPVWSLAILLLIASVSVAQQPPRLVDPPAGATAPPLNVPANNALNDLLGQWEQRMKSIQGIEATVRRTEVDAVTNAKEVFEGSAKFLRPDRADLYLKKLSNPQLYERFLLTGTYLYEFRPQQKAVRVHTIPQRAPGQPAMEDNFMGLLFGMSSQEAKRRYDLQLKEKAGDTWYSYLLVKPRMPADKAEFTEARLVLWQANRPNGLLPAQISFGQTNGNTIQWDILNINAAPKLGPTDFAKPQVPKDWQWITVPPPAGGPASAAPPSSPPPTKVRQSGGN